MSHGLVYPSTPLVRRFGRRLRRRRLLSLPLPHVTALLSCFSSRCTHFSLPFPLFSCTHVACFVHAKQIQRTSSHKSPRVPPQIPKGVCLDLAVQLQPHPSKTGCNCSSLGREVRCNCSRTVRRRVQLRRTVVDEGATAPSTLGMPLPTPRTTRTRAFFASNMRGTATRSNRTTSSTTKRHALAQPPSSVNTYQRPDATGRYGKFGGKYVPETLIAALEELESTYREVVTDEGFQKELQDVLKNYVGRETPLYFAEQLTQHYRKDGKGPDIYLKREDLNHTGAHKINNAVGQALLAKRIGKNRIIAETGAGQHGVATATVCARFGLKCIVYMGAQDMERQKLNVFRMRLMGAEVRPVHSGTATLKDATSEAIRDWVTNVESTHYILGSVAGPHPYPMMVRDFHACIGRETRKQCLEAFGGKPDVLMACVGGGSNAMGLFHEFVDDEDIRLIGVEAAGEGVGTEKHAATLTKGTPGVLHGSFSMLLQDKDGQITEPHSISAGLDYPGIGPEHAFLKDIGRGEYFSVTDKEALDAFQLVSRLEGIIPALETSHAFAYLEQLCPTLPEGTKLVINCSGRGDKDVNTAAKYLMGEDLL